MLESPEISTERGRVWSAEQLALQRWLSLPRQLRRPKTHNELAEELGISTRTLRYWKHLPGWDDAMRALVKAAVFDSADVQQRILYALVRKAEQGSFNHQRLYLELAGIYNPKGAEVEANVKVLFGVEAEEI